MFLSPDRPFSYTVVSVCPFTLSLLIVHTSVSRTVPFSKICCTTSSSLLVPNSSSRVPLDAVSSWP
jgi:hypothetical protein